ncbi:MAG: Protein-disulfide isomerase [Candidatus Levybacteria bacterium GW2011_GWB1_35_5]|nr:MAG: Protein-disulfide isomerase [Candidatus Levybacteria bacterium GW2011_GWB1_35_5]
MAKAKKTSVDLVKTTTPTQNLPSANLRNTAEKILKPFNFVVRLAKSYRPKSYTPILAVLLIIAAFLLGILITKVQYLEKGQTTEVTDSTVPSEDNNQLQPGQKVDVGVGHLPPLGDPNAKVKIIEFADLRCPFCDQFYKEAQQSIINDYVKTGKAVLYFRHFEFLGPASIVAGNAVECANEQGKFWEMHNWLYDNQPSESDTSMYTNEKMTQTAGTLGINTSQFKSCMDSNKYQANLDKDMSEGQSAGVSGTPTIFINGRSIVGAEPYASIKPVIEQALGE